MDGIFHFLALSLEVFFLDLVLSGDNAVVIGLACRVLPVPERRRVMVAGTAIAIAMRIVLTLLASFVLRVPLLKLLGGIALAAIAVRLTLQEQGEPDETGQVTEATLLSVLGAVVVADLAMSTDNVVALAALAQGNVAILALGLALSVPLLMFGSWYVTVLLQRYPALTPIAGAMLGWLAGDIAVSDPLYASWIQRQSPALAVVVPLLVVAYVLAQSRIIDRTRPAAATLRPAPARQRALKPAESAARAMRPATRQALAPTQSASPAPIAAGERKAPLRRTIRPWLIGGGVLAAVASGAVLLNLGRLPAPGGLIEYDCAGQGYVLRYRPGGDRIRLASSGNTASAIVRPSLQIDWGDLHDTSKTLGFVPPTLVVYADARTLRVDGGMAGGVVCRAR
jgi:YjbE family integral membrane protein